jgi:hypothetical protein
VLLPVAPSWHSPGIFYFLILHMKQHFNVFFLRGEGMYKYFVRKVKGSKCLPCSLEYLVSVMDIVE